ncbi:MAG: hypothetical protein ACLP5V_07255 [Candidatus Bathyarchaeia archaeon]
MVKKQPKTSIRTKMTTRVEADLLIPGLGDPISNGCVVFDVPKISYAGPIEGAPASVVV